MSYYGQPYRAPGAQPPPAPSTRYFDYAKWQAQQAAAKAKPAAAPSSVHPQAMTTSVVYAPNAYAAPGTSSYATVASSTKPSYVTYNPYSSQPSYGAPSNPSSSVSYYGGGSQAKPSGAANVTAAPSYGSSYAAPVASYGSNGYGSSYAAPVTNGNNGYGITPATKPATVPAPAPAPVQSVAATVKVNPNVTCAITKAVFIGINYTGQRGLELKGCVNDVSNSMTLFKSMGANLVDEQNVRVLCDPAPKGKRRPTRTEMLQAMAWLTQDCKEGDVLWFHYSGHGSQERDKTGQEADGLAESIIPVDYTTNGSIVDDDLYKLLVQPLKKGVVLYAIFDCCHSGTILDLRYIFDEASGTLVIDQDYRERRDDEGTVFMLSGCMSTQTSADLPPDTRQGLKAQSVGAMTSSYLPLIASGLAWPNFTKALRTGLKKSRLAQVPQFEMSRPCGLGEVAFRYAFPSLGGVSGKGRGADEKYVPHEDVAKHVSKHTHKLRKKAAAAAAAAAAAGEDDEEDDGEGEDDEEAYSGRGVPTTNGYDGNGYANGYRNGNGNGTVANGRYAPQPTRPVYATAAGNPYAAPSLASVARYPGQPQVTSPPGRPLPGVQPQTNGVTTSMARGSRRF